MYTITHCWINDRPLTPEANCTVNGLFNTLEEARKGFENWLETTPKAGCSITRLTQDQVSFLTPDGNKRGFVEIKCLDEF